MRAQPQRGEVTSQVYATDKRGGHPPNSSLANFILGTSGLSNQNVSMEGPLEFIQPTCPLKTGFPLIPASPVAMQSSLM